MTRPLCLTLLLLISWTANAGTYVQFRTTVGNIDVELYDADKPVTVQNFLRYVKAGRYRNMFLHRCVPGFVVQGGGYTVANPTSNTDFVEAALVPSFGFITNEYNVGRRLSNVYGTLAMAKLATNANTASSEWFFNLANNSANLDNQNGGFTVFGRALGSTTNVLNNFNARAYGQGLVDMTWRYPAADAFTHLPVTYTNAAYLPWYSELIYVLDISLVNIRVKHLTNKTAEISWNSVAGKTNYIEYTALTNRPPTWTTLSKTNGNGASLKVVDASTNAPRRFYRVRVDY